VRPTGPCRGSFPEYLIFFEIRQLLPQGDYLIPGFRHAALSERYKPDGSVNNPDCDGNIVPGTERRPDPGIEETEVIVDLGGGPDRAPGIFRGRLLLDGDRG